MIVNDSVALVTGGASGLGLATAKALLGRRRQRRHRRPALVRTARRSPRELGDAAASPPADVTDEADVTAALDLADALGPLRVVGQLRRHRQRRSGPSARRASSRSPTSTEGRQRQPDRHVQRASASPPSASPHDRADRRRARRHRQHRLGRRLRRPDRPGRLLRVQGRRRRHDPADRPRPRLAAASASSPSRPACSRPRCSAGAARGGTGLARRAGAAPVPARRPRRVRCTRRSTSSPTRCSTARSSASTAPSAWPRADPALIPEA